MRKVINSLIIAGSMLGRKEMKQLKAGSSRSTNCVICNYGDGTVIHRCVSGGVPSDHCPGEYVSANWGECTDCC